MNYQVGSETLYATAKIVRDYGPTSRAAIARALTISPSTIGRSVDYLLSQGLLIEVGQSTSVGAGRPSIMLRFNSEIGGVITVDLRLTEAHAAITNLAGDIQNRAIREISIKNEEKSVSDLIALIQELADSSDSPPIEAIVIGAPSLVDSERGVLEWAPSLGWRNIPLKQILEERFRIPTLLENDVNLAALGEFWRGAGQSVKNNLVFVSAGTGIGAGIILDGKLFRGASNAAGEVAYFITDVKVLRDNAMQIAHLENRVGREGLIRMAQIVAQRYPTSQLADLLYRERDSIRTRDIFQLAESGDQAARIVFNELVEILTVVVCNISVLLDPEMIILGGPSDWKWTGLISEIQEYIGSSLLRSVNLQPSQLGQDALIIGGAYSALQYLTIFESS